LCLNYEELWRPLNCRVIKQQQQIVGFTFFLGYKKVNKKRSNVTWAQREKLGSAHKVAVCLPVWVSESEAIVATTWRGSSSHSVPSTGSWVEVQVTHSLKVSGPKQFNFNASRSADNTEEWNKGNNCNCKSTAPVFPAPQLLIILVASGTTHPQMHFECKHI